MKKLILLCWMLVASNAYAENIIDCSAIVNEHVTIRSVTSDKLAQSGVSGGGAEIDNNGRLVIVYEEVYENLPEVKNHILAHECAHHALGHVFAPVIRNYWANERIKEYPADCMASQILVQQLRYGKEEFQKIADFLLRQDPYTGAARAQRVINCAN